MSRYLNYKYIAFFATTVLMYALCIAGIVMLCLYIPSHPLSVNMPPDLNGISETSRQVKQSFGDLMKSDHYFDAADSVVYKVSGKKEINNFAVALDKDGSLYNLNFWNTTDIQMKDAAQRIRRLQDRYCIDGNGERTANLIVLLFPGKYDKDRTRGYVGIPYQNKNDSADDFLQYLRRYSVDYVDYRQWISDRNWTTAEVFYYTDPAWNTVTALRATRHLVRHIRGEYGINLDPDDQYLNPAGYSSERYRNLFAGRYAQWVGRFYTRYDDYTFLLPGFETDFNAWSENLKGEKTIRNGSFEEAFTTRRFFDEPDILEREMYKTYLGSAHVKYHAENRLASETAPNILFLWDNWSPEMVAFIANSANITDSLNVEYADEDRIDLEIEENNYDYILIGVSVDSLDSKLFPYEIETGTDADSEVSNE